MNFKDERFQLIDISSEDDFLIGSHLNDTSLDLRLSVSLETQKELISSSKSNYCTETDNLLNLSEKEQKPFRLVKESDKEKCNARKSLAWDHAFFTSPGFLELEELCLVNSGFKNLDLSSSHEIEENLRSKVCHSRYPNNKPGVEARCRQQSSKKTKMASPSKIMPIQGSKQYMTTGRSEYTNSRKELSKSTVNDKKPPLRAISRYGNGVIVSKQPELFSYDTNTSPCKTSMDLVRTEHLLKSHSKEGDGKEADSEDLHSLTHDINARQSFNVEGHQYHQRHQNCIQQSLERCETEKSVTKETKSSHISSTRSSLRLPSQKIGFFDMKLETCRHDQDSIKLSNKGQRRRNNQSSSTKKSIQSLNLEEKENMHHPEDAAIEFRPMKGSASPSKLVTVGSMTSSGQYSSSSEKRLTKTQRPRRQVMLSPTRSRTPFSTKVTPPLKKSAMF